MTIGLGRDGSTSKALGRATGSSRFTFNNCTSLTKLSNGTVQIPLTPTHGISFNLAHWYSLSQVGCGEHRTVNGIEILLLTDLL